MGQLSQYGLLKLFQESEDNWTLPLSSGFHLNSVSFLSFLSLLGLLCS